MSLSTLHPSPCVGGSYMHPLSSTISVNDLKLTRDDPWFNKTWMDGCSGCLIDMIDSKVSSW